MEPGCETRLHGNENNMVAIVFPWLRNEAITKHGNVLNHTNKRSLYKAKSTPLKIRYFTPDKTG